MAAAEQPNSETKTDVPNRTKYPSGHQPIWDFDKQINSFECAKSGTISYREKRNPLANTRLSCYKPKITDNYSLPHYKSVDDFLYLTADEVGSSSGSDYSGDTFDSSNGPAKSKVNEAVTSNFHSTKLHVPAASHEETYGFSKLTTKSVEDILEPRLYAASPIGKKNNMAGLSEKIKCVSKGTQKLFSRIVNNSSGKPIQTEMNGSVLANETMPNQESDFEISKVSKSRRSLSYGNLPGLDDFRQTFKNFQKSQKRVTSELKEELTFKEPPIKDDLLVGCEDTDSGILVNESGQSSIIETDEVFTDAGSYNSNRDESVFSLQKYLKASTQAHHSTRAINTDVNAKFEFKFVRICINEHSADRSLGFGVKTIRSDVHNKRVGYEVANIVSGGRVDR